MKRFTIIRQVSYRMTLILFTVFAGKTCSAGSPLPEDFHANFGGDPFTGDTPDDIFKRQVLHRNGASFGQCMTALPKEPRYVMNLKLPHRQMHYRQRPFLKDFTMKSTTKGVKNTLPGHEKLKIC